MLISRLCAVVALTGLAAGTAHALDPNLSPAEAFRAIRAGAHALKIFPAEVLGAKGIKAIKAVLPPQIPIYAVGGAAPETFAEFFAAGCTGFGIGSYLYKPGMTLAEIATRAGAIVTAYDKAKPR